MLATSERTSEKIAANVGPVDKESVPEPHSDAVTGVLIRGGDRLMMWLLAGFFFFLGAIVLSEVLFKVILGLSV